jgi:hypothetical protein
MVKLLISISVQAQTRNTSEIRQNATYQNGWLTGSGLRRYTEFFR